jgi:predicted nucleic acid-binding protein
VRLHEIDSGTTVFLDANIFVYHFSEGSAFNKSCTDFLIRVESSEIHGITSAATVLEATHRLMMVEASASLDVETRNLPKYLKQHPDTAKQLLKHMSAPPKIASMNIEIVPVTATLVEKSQGNKTKYGFLSNDALVISVMEELGIIALASNDHDFSRVEWIKLYAPFQVQKTE